MKYNPKLPAENNNISPRHPLREFAFLLSALVAIVLLAYWLLGLFIDMAVDAIEPATEIQIYQSTGINRLNALEKPSDELVDEALLKMQTSSQQLLSALAQCTDIGYPVNLRLEESEVVNALAWPGGHIAVMSGLLDKVQSQNGLAFVLAHELAHFKNRDHLRSMGRSVVLLSLSTLVGGANGDMSQLVMSLTNLRAAQFSQQQESAADATALDILNCHYGHVGGATEFFELIKQSGETFDVALMHYFSSHPQMQARIDAIKRLSQSKGYSAGEVKAYRLNIY